METESEIVLHSIKSVWDVSNRPRNPQETAQLLTKLARWLDNKFKFITMDEKYREIFVYIENEKDENFGTWIDKGERVINEQTAEILPDISKHNQGEIINRIRNVGSSPRKIFNPPNLIGFQNCVLNLDTWEFMNHSPDHFLTKKIPVIYDPARFPEKFETFINEIIRPEDRNLIFEIMAHCFMNDYRFQKAFIFLGEGANGKSTLLSVLRTLLGNENVSGYQLQDFEKNQFAASNLFGKMANIAPDISSKAMYSTSVFRTLTGGDYASHNVKNRSPIDFINIAKLLFSCNQLPLIREDVLALWRRLCVINFDKIISPEEQDEELLDKLTTQSELSGILNILLFALFRLINRGNFQGLKSIVDTRNSYILQSDVIHAYAENCLDENEDGFISNERLFRDLNDYAKFIGLAPKTKQSISKQLPMWKTSAYPITRERKKKQVRGWKGIEINDWREGFEN